MRRAFDIAPVRADPAEPPPASTSHLFADTLA
jgi:hypothetical protein